MRKKVYRVRTQYIFEGVFEVVAESREDARQKVIQDCGMVMGGNVHSTLPDEEINWAFSMYPEVRTGEDNSSRRTDRIKRSADLPTVSIGGQRKPDEKHLVTFDSELSRPKAILNIILSSKTVFPFTFFKSNTSSFQNVTYVFADTL